MRSWGRITRAGRDLRPRDCGRSWGVGSLREGAAGLAERVALHLGGRMAELVGAPRQPGAQVTPHRPKRGKLKNGEIRLLVATASLELGIDVTTLRSVVSRSIRHVQSLSRCSVLAFWTLAWRNTPRDGFSPRPATTWWNVPPPCAPSTLAILIAFRSHLRHWTSWRSRLWPCAVARTGTRRAIRLRAPGVSLSRTAARRYDRVLEMLSQG